MLKNILFGRRTKKWKKGVFFREWGFFVKRGRWRGVKEGRGGPRKGGVTGKREVAASPPYRLSLPETVHLFTLGDKVLWILMLRVKEHGSRGITGWFFTRVRVRAHYMCDHFLEKPVFRQDGRDLKGGAWRKAPKKRRSGYVWNERELWHCSFSE